jgi:hypothetical protein
MATYYLGVSNIIIEEIRSASSDTLELSTAVKVLNADGGLHRAAETAYRQLGDRPKGERIPLNLGFKQIDVPNPTDDAPEGGTIYWSFVLVNKGNPDSRLEPALNTVANNIIDAPTSSGDVMTAVVGDLPGSAGLLNLFGGCDGVVAAQAWSLTAAELDHKTQPPGWTELVTYPGLDSGPFCGANSLYGVVFTNVEPIIPPPPKLVRIPRLVGMTRQAAEKWLVENELIPGIFALQETETYDPGTVVAQRTGEGQEVPVHSEVLLAIAVASRSKNGRNGGGGHKNP